MTKLYTFDMTLRAAVTVEGESEDEARRIIEGIIDDGAYFRAFEGEPGDYLDMIEGECSLHGELELGLIDGEEPNSPD